MDVGRKRSRPGFGRPAYNLFRIRVRCPVPPYAADAALMTRPDLRVFFITGYAENAVSNHGYLAQGMQVMTKPFEMEAQAKRLQALFE